MRVCTPFGLTENATLRLFRAYDRTMGDDKIEMQDSMGSVTVPADALYQAQTQRALNNFQISSLRLPAAIILALALIKHSCAAANLDLGKLDSARSEAIKQAASSIIDGKYDDQFAIDVFQTGSGTSSNMNLNEVIATLASNSKLKGSSQRSRQHGAKFQRCVSVRDSRRRRLRSARTITTSDTRYSRICVAAQAVASSIEHIIKTGRTHLMDAMPIAWGRKFPPGHRRSKMIAIEIQTTLMRLQQLAMGGTAVGTGVNTSPDFGKRVCAKLAQATGIRFTPHGEPV